MAIKTFTAGSVLTASDTNTFLANAGLVYIGTQTLSGAATDINSIFSDTYRNYRLIFSNVTSSADDYIGFRMRTVAAEAQTDYYQAASNVTFAGVVSGNGGNPLTYGRLGYFGTFVGGITMDILAPNVATSTIATYQSLGSAQTWSGAVQHAVSTAYTGLRILSATGKTITGDVKIYGYRQA